MCLERRCNYDAKLLWAFSIVLTILWVLFLHWLAIKGMEIWREKHPNVEVNSYYKY